jgi:D-alanyl-D-alanine carboxypeptidase
MQQNRRIPQMPQKKKNKLGYVLLILFIAILVNLCIINVYIFTSGIDDNGNSDIDINKMIAEAVEEAINEYREYLSYVSVAALNVIDAEPIDADDAEDIPEETTEEEIEDEPEEPREPVQYLDINEILADDLLYIDSPYYEPDIPILLNRDNPIPDDYDHDLVYIDNTHTHILNSRAADALIDMMATARQSGVSLWIVSAYRSHARQTRNFNNNINILVSHGWNREEAYWETARYIAIPGTSEHEAGLAVDFNLINERFDQTREFAWLIENSVYYGFILRYPQDTEHITNIIYEPWHFRYVGINHAKKIVELDITLDEYVSILKRFE